MARDEKVVRVDFRQRRRMDDDDALPEPPPPLCDEPDPTADVATKAELFDELIGHGLVTITFDTRCQGVRVPEQFRGTPQLHLAFSHRFRLDDLRYDQHRVQATLSFDTGDFCCFIPWSAVYAMTGETADQGYVFEESFPQELLAMLPSLLAMAEDEDAD